MKLNLTDITLNTFKLPLRPLFMKIYHTNIKRFSFLIVNRKLHVPTIYEFDDKGITG